MNPALLNYLQNNQAQTQGNQQANPQPNNPFDSGIQKAIESARMSLGMTKGQQETAFNNAALTFADNIAQAPREKGFWNNFASAGRALSPALQSYNNAEEQALTQNNALANQILEYQAAEQERAAKEEERAWYRQHAQNQLAEQRRYHDSMYGNNGLGGANNIPPDAFIPIESQATLNKYIDEKKKFGAALKEVKDIINYDATLKKNYAEDFANPTGPFSKITAPVENLWGIFANNQRLKEKTAKREAFNSQLVELKSGLEQKLKGGVLGPKILEYFDREKLYPTIDNTEETRQEKFNNILKKLNDNYESADLSLKYKREIDPANLEQFKNYLNPGQHNSEQQTASHPQQVTPNNNAQPVSNVQYVKVYDPDNPTVQKEVHPDWVSQAEKQGWQRL